MNSCLTNVKQNAIMNKILDIRQVKRIGEQMKDIITDLQDMRYLNWAKTRKSSVTAGSFLKSYDDSGRTKIYYKLSDYDQVKGIVGHECVNEIVVQRILQILGIEHLEYRLIHAMVRIEGRDYETWLCASEDYKRDGESKVALEDYYAMEKKDGEMPLDFCKRMGWERQIYGMLVIDYLVLNRDRHGANMEVLRNPKNKTVRLAPLFDHGISLVCRCHTLDELKKYDVLEDKRVQFFVGTNSVLQNVRMVPKEFLNQLPKLKKSDLTYVFEGLREVVGKEYVLKMREMIWKRWCELDHV